MTKPPLIGVKTFTRKRVKAKEDETDTHNSVSV
jgi:hypothetical protein